MDIIFPLFPTRVGKWFLWVGINHFLFKLTKKLTNLLAQFPCFFYQFIQLIIINN